MKFPVDRAGVPGKKIKYLPGSCHVKNSQKDFLQGCSEKAREHIHRRHELHTVLFTNERNLILTIKMDAGSEIPGLVPLDVVQFKYKRPSPNLLNENIF